jgi:RND family efflux transporter MFP subunit
MRSWTLRIGLGLLGLALLAGGSLSCGRAKPGGPKGAAPEAKGGRAAAPVSVVTAMRGPIRDTVRVTGTVHALREVQVTPEGAGRVTGVYADVGDRVARGSLLLRFDTDLLAAQVRQAEAGVELAQARLKQAKDTVALTGSTTGISVEQALKQVDSARSQLAKAETGASTTETAVNNRIAQAQLGVQQAQTALTDVRRGARDQQKRQVQAQVEIAQAGYEFAKSQYEVKKRLYTQGAASGTEFGQALAEFQQARSALEQAKQQASLVEEGPTTEQVHLAELQVEQAKEQLKLAEAQRDQITLAREDVQLARTAVRLAEDQLALARAGRGEVTVRSSDIDAARAGVRQAQASRDLARTTLGRQGVYAPISGLVSARMTDPGESAGPGEAAFTLVDVSSVYIHAVLGEADVDRVRPGQRATVTVRSVGATALTGRVVDVNPGSLRGQRNFVARILLQNPNEVLRPGMSAEVSLLVGENAGAVLVPVDAIVEDRDKRLVYAVIDGKIDILPVQVGSRDAGRAEITDGLQAGTQVVVAGQNDLAEGQPVQPVQREGGA